MTNKTDLRGKIESLINSDELSPYRLGKVESVVRGKVIPPQKIYGYVRQGYIKSTKNQLGKMVISKEEAIRYLMKTMANNS